MGYGVGMSERGVSASDRWLLLVHQLPAKPAYLRVKVWRRLQGIGAVPVKHGVYALPAGEQAQEDFAWLMREIVEGGGEAMVCEARLVDGLSDAEVRARFNAARDAAYGEIAEEARGLAKTLDKSRDPDRLTGARPQIAKLRARFDQVAGIDFFEAAGQVPTESLIATLEAKLSPEEKSVTAPAATALKGRVWVTRQGVQVDRIASAWLIRRFIDPDAKLKFVPGKGYKPQSGELRFDMFDAEYTHEGDRCTFEVLIQRCGLKDAALTAIAEIVHDIDLKDAKYGREEASGIARVIAGIAMATADDNQRIARGTETFDSLYAYFRQTRAR
jgi:hypothetical protein